MAGSSGETLYSVYTPWPDVLQLGRANAVSLPIHRDGAVVTPTAGTFTLLAPGGQTLVDAAAVTVNAEGVSTYPIPAAVLATTVAGVVSGEGYQELWRITIDGVVYPFDREAAVALRPISPSLRVEDLAKEYVEITRLKGAIDIQDILDASWGDIVRRWIREGGCTYKVKSPWAFLEPHRELAMARFWRQLAASRPQSEQYMALYETHRKAYEAAWAGVNVSTDDDDDGRVDDPSARSRKGLVLNINVPPPHSRRYGGGRW
jgi:hypothetical protein